MNEPKILKLRYIYVFQRSDIPETVFIGAILSRLTFPGFLKAIVDTKTIPNDNSDFEPARTTRIENAHVERPKVRIGVRGKFGAEKSIRLLKFCNLTAQSRS